MEARAYEKIIAGLEQGRDRLAAEVERLATEVAELTHKFNAAMSAGTRMEWRANQARTHFQLARATVKELQAALTASQQSAQEQRRAGMELDYHKRCRDCGRFLKREYWTLKYYYANALCPDCMSNYED